MQSLNNNNIYCVNCGKKGHVIKICKDPITSFGILLFKISLNQTDDIFDKNFYLSNILKNVYEADYPKIKFLLVQRRDTMGYTDFLRGKYDNENLMYIFLNEMTVDEKQKIRDYTFDELWNMLWINKNGKIYKTEYDDAKKKFESLEIDKIVEKSKSCYYFQEFSIPKGRKNINESNLKCAERELFEETGFDKTQYNYIDCPPFIEEFTGTDGVKYRHVYYLAKIKNNIRKLPDISKTQLMEIRNKGWFSLNECAKLIRPYDVEKIKVIKNAHDNIMDALVKKNFIILKK